MEKSTKSVKKKTATRAASTASKSKTSKTATSKANTGMNGKGRQSMLEKFFVDELKDIYWAEKHLTKALPKLKRGATSPELAEAFENHLAQTEEHVTRLEGVFELLGETPRAKKCEAMEGLAEEAQTIMEDTRPGTATRDVGLILAAQKVEHYEIATYGGLAQLAKTIGRDDIAEILQQTLAEEKEADELLSNIAANASNKKAEEEEETED